MQKEELSERLQVERFEILEIDEGVLFTFDPVTNTCCPVNTDCSCFLNVIFGCGSGGCGEGS
jgi:hypothetical protein